MNTVPTRNPWFGWCSNCPLGARRQARGRRSPRHKGDGAGRPKCPPACCRRTFAKPPSVCPPVGASRREPNRGQTWRQSADGVEIVDPRAYSLARAALETAERELGCHVAVTSHWIDIHTELFGPEDLGLTQLGTAIACRFVRLLHLDEGVTPLLDKLQRGLEEIARHDGSFHWFERLEGSADFVRLVHRMPSMSGAAVAAFA